MGGVEGFVVEEGEGAGGEGADEERTVQTWGMSDRYGVVVGVFGGLVNHGEDSFDVGAGGYLGDDATVEGVEVDLGNDDVGKNLGAVFDDGGGGFVTTGLNT